MAGGKGPGDKHAEGCWDLAMAFPLPGRGKRAADAEFREQARGEAGVPKCRFPRQAGGKRPLAPNFGFLYFRILYSGH